MPQKTLTQRLGMAGAAYTFRHIIGSINSWAVSPVILKLLGFEIGVIVMSLVMFFITYAFIKLYDFTKLDWFSVEYVKKLREKSEIAHPSTHWLVLRIASLSRAEELSLFILLMLVDPMVVVLYYRTGSYRWNGIPSLTVWFLFIMSSFLSSLAWAYLLKGLYLVWAHIILYFS